MSSTRASRLEAHILTYSLTIITSLLLLLMLLWHISTAHLIDNYGLPEDWEEDFRYKEFSGGKGALWAVLFVVIPANCVFALLALDYYHRCRYDRGEDDIINAPESVSAPPSTGDSTVKPTTTTVHADNDVRRRWSSISDSEASVTSARAHTTKAEMLGREPLHTHHPLHSPRLGPRERFYFQTAYDTLMVGLLVIHIVFFFTSIPSNMRACDRSYRGALRDNDPFHAKKLTVKQRCKRINIDIHVSGGFDMAVALVLLTLHMWHFFCRIYEFREEWSDDCGGPKDEEAGKPGIQTIGRSLPDRQFIARSRSRSSCASTSNFEKGGTFANAKKRNTEHGGRKRRRSTTASTRSSHSGSRSSNWDAALLECLVP